MASILILGASVRAAAFSALRAELRPWCADLFADADLRARCPVTGISRDIYPNVFEEMITRTPASPWMYTGGLENRRSLVDRISRLRPLWGNGAESLRRSCSPRFLFRLFENAGIPCPRIGSNASLLDRQVPWLVKPRASAGGANIGLWSGDTTQVVKRGYFQEFIEGVSHSAVYLGNNRGARLLGVTRQLVGKPWLNASEFHYCGSIGPISPEPILRTSLERLGNVLVEGCALRGLFGVDFILRDSIPWPVEVNPRYPASVEVLEYATGISMLSLHRGVFDGDAPAADKLAAAPDAFVGKAVLFAAAPILFPQEGPWQEVLATPRPIEEMPAFADIPAVGERIPAGWPVFTLFSRAASVEKCEESLREIAGELNSSFWDKRLRHHLDR